MACDIGPISEPPGYKQIVYEIWEHGGPPRIAFVLRADGTCAIDPVLLRKFAQGTDAPTDASMMMARTLLAATLGEAYPATKSESEKFQVGILGEVWVKP